MWLTARQPLGISKDTGHIFKTICLSKWLKKEDLLHLQSTTFKDAEGKVEHLAKRIVAQLSTFPSLA